MNKNKTYTAAIIGTGRIGFTLGFDKKREQPASHTMALLYNKRIKIVAGCDTNPENLEKWHKYIKNAEIFSSSKKLYEKFVPDIIVVAVNESSHLKECYDAINAKPKLVILEKPVALNSAEAAKIHSMAEKNLVPVMVNHERRFSKDYLAAKDFIPKIGDIQTVRGELLSGLRIYGKEFEDSGAYSLLHDGTHLVDIIQYILNCKLEKPVITGLFKDENGLVRNFSAHYSTDKIPEITVTMSGRSKFFEFGIEILGTLGKICVGNGYANFYTRKESKLYSGFYSLTKDKVKLPKKTGYFANMIQNAIDFLDGTEKLISPLEDAILDLKVLEDIKEKLCL